MTKLFQMKHWLFKSCMLTEMVSGCMNFSSDDGQLEEIVPCSADLYISLAPPHLSLYMAATCCDLLSPLICHVLVPFHTCLPSLPLLSIRAFRSAATRNNMFGKYAPVKLHKTLPLYNGAHCRKRQCRCCYVIFLPLFYFSFLYLDKALKLICSLFSIFTSIV